MWLIYLVDENSVGSSSLKRKLIFLQNQITYNIASEIRGKKKERIIPISMYVEANNI